MKNAANLLWILESYWKISLLLFVDQSTLYSELIEKSYFCMSFVIMISQFIVFTTIFIAIIKSDDLNERLDVIIKTRRLNRFRRDDVLQVKKELKETTLVFRFLRCTSFFSREMKSTIVVRGNLSVQLLLVVTLLYGVNIHGKFWITHLLIEN